MPSSNSTTRTGRVEEGALRILYATGRYSPLKHDEGSGTDYRLYHSILDQGVEMKFIGPFPDKPSLLERGYRKLHALFTNLRPAKYSGMMLKQGARTLANAVKEYQPDIIFTKNLAPLVRYKAQLPVVYMLDSTVAAFNRGWPTFSSIENWRMVRWEKKVLQQATCVITRSDWTKNSLIHEYRYPAEKIHIVHNCSSLPDHVIPDQLTFDEPDFSTIRLLFVGRVLKLKGIDIAMEIVNQLNQSGKPAELRIVGLEGQDQPHIHYAGTFKKSIDSQLKAYANQYLWPHFLLHPARYDAAPIVTAEAAAFGVPTITNAVGGIASTVENGVSGIVLPALSPAEAYVKVITHFIDHPQEYIDLRRKTRERYERELNWAAASRKIVSIIHEVAGESRHNDQHAGEHK